LGWDDRRGCLLIYQNIQNELQKRTRRKGGGGGIRFLPGCAGAEVDVVEDEQDDDGGGGEENLAVMKGQHRGLGTRP